MLDQLSQLYRGDADASNPYLSPLHGSFVGLPPLLIQVGEAEVLYDDSANVIARAKAQGVDAHLEAVADMVHVWHLFAPMLQEGRDAIERAGKFLSGQLDR
jgi:acetyl esterase/lipase